MPLTLQYFKKMNLTKVVPGAQSIKDSICDSRIKVLTLIFLQQRTRWKLARFSPKANFEPLSIRLQDGIRFFHHPIPALHCANLTAGLPSATKEQYRLTTFRMNNRVG